MQPQSPKSVFRKWKRPALTVTALQPVAMHEARPGPRFADADGSLMFGGR